MIKNITRGHIEFEYEGKSITIYGEALLPGYGSPDFVIYSNMLNTWDPPYEKDNIDKEEKSKILSSVVTEMKKKGMTVEIE
ncbi:MAG: hypothetical protein KKD44_01550 [Proteobacteria bacterium]|nr:hypothetical protein [Pseudomonadota bacterium]